MESPEEGAMVVAVVWWLVLGVLAALTLHWFALVYRTGRDGTRGPPPHFLLGNTLDIVRYMTTLHHRIYQGHLRFGRTFRTWMFAHPVLNFAAPEDLHTVLVADFDRYDRNALERSRFGDFLGDGIILQRNGPRWRRARTALQPAFSRASLRGQVPHFSERTRALFRRLDVSPIASSSSSLASSSSMPSSRSSSCSFLSPSSTPLASRTPSLRSDIRSSVSSKNNAGNRFSDCGVLDDDDDVVVDDSAAAAAAAADDDDEVVVVGGGGKKEEKDEMERKMREDGNRWMRVDVEAALQQLTFDVIGYVALGVRLDTLDSNNSEFARAWHDITSFMLSKFFVPLPTRLGPWRTSGQERFDAALTLLHRTIDGLVLERSAEIAAGDDSGRTDVLTELLRQRAVDPAARAWLTAQQMRSEITTLLFAGHDTTTNAIAWSLYYLAANPDVQARARAEVLRVLDEHGVECQTSPELTYDVVSVMRYLRAVFYESLRLKPSAPLRGRTCTEPVTLAGCSLPAGSTLAWSAYSVHRLPDVWPDPNAFRPERFMSDDWKARPCAFVAFGAGPRRCIGEHMAVAEGVTVLAHFLLEWQLRLPGGAPPPPDPALFGPLRDDEIADIERAGYIADALDPAELAAVRHELFVEAQPQNEQFVLTMRSACGIELELRRRMRRMQ
jgi:cytochrome P450